LGGVEMGLAVASASHRRGGIQAALDYLIKTSPRADPALADAAEDTA